MCYKKIFAICFLVLILTSCAHSENKSQETSEIKKPSPEKYIPSKNIRINGIDFKQVQLENGKFGGEINLSIFGSGPKTFNPWAATDATSSEIGGLLFDGLFDTDPVTGEMVPKLAKDYKILDGGKKIIVTLRDGIKWSDGKEITADDVVFTWNNIVFKELDGGGFHSLCLIDGKYPEVKKINNKIIEFKTHSVFAPFLRQISYQPAPKHIFEKILNGKSKEGAKKELLRFWGQDVNPSSLVTSGPFKLLRYVDGERVELVKNENYYVINKKNERLPYLNKLVYVLIQDKSFELFKFLASELDSITIRGEDVSLITEAKKKNKKFELVNLGPTSSTEFLVLNLTEKKNTLSSEWFNNLNFRKAISYAIDRIGIVDNVLAGIGKPLFTAESHASIFLNENLANGHPQDLAIAKKLLKEVGFKWNKTKDLIDKKGNKVEFTILTNAENTNRQATAVIIQDDLKKLGMKVNLRPIDFNTLIGRSDTGDWEVILIGFTGDFFEPNGGANVWRLDGRLHMFDGKPHKPREWEKEIDYLFNEGTKHVSFTERKKYYDRFQEIAYNELPFIYLTSPLRIVGYQKTVGNVIPTVYGGVLHNVESIYKKEI